jgi:sorting nexin-1/2
MEEVSADVVKQQGIAIDEDDLSLSPPEVDEPEQPQQYSNNNNSGETITIEEPSYAQKHEESAATFEISLSDPEKHGDGMNAYVTYAIKTRTKSNLLKAAQLIVDRRYNDFVWLHERLSQQYKGIIIPPLPEKGVINRFSPEFIEHRRRELERFLRRSANHQTLQHSEHLKAFLELSDEELVQWKEGKKQKKGFMAFLGEKVSNVQVSMGTPKEIDQWFESHKTYVDNLEQQLQTMLNRSSAISKRQKEMMQMWTEFAQTAALIGATERDSDKVLQSIFDKTAAISNQLAVLQKELSESQILQFEDTLSDYTRLVDAVKDALNNRSQSLYMWQMAQKTVEQKREKQAKNNDLKAQREVEEAQKKEEEAKAEYDDISASVKSEIEKFKAQKGKDIVLAITEFVQAYMNHEVRVVRLWKEMLEFIQDAQIARA